MTSDLTAIMAPLDKFVTTGYVHGRVADLPWPVVMPTSGTWGGDATARWGLKELARTGLVIPWPLRGPVAQILFDIYELGQDEG